MNDEVRRFFRIALIALAILAGMRLLARAQDYPNRDPAYEVYIWPERQRYWDHLETLDAIEQSRRDTESYLYWQRQMEEEAESFDDYLRSEGD